MSETIKNKIETNPDKMSFLEYILSEINIVSKKSSTVYSVLDFLRSVAKNTERKTLSVISADDVFQDIVAELIVRLPAMEDMDNEEIAEEVRRTANKCCSYSTRNILWSEDQNGNIRKRFLKRTSTASAEERDLFFEILSCEEDRRYENYNRLLDDLKFQVSDKDLKVLSFHQATLSFLEVADIENKSEAQLLKEFKDFRKDFMSDNDYYRNYKEVLADIIKNSISNNF